MTAVVDSGLFESTMSLPLHNHFRLYIGGDFFVYRRHYCWPVSFCNGCLRDRCYCGWTGWLQQSYSERLRPFSSYTVPFWAPIYLYYHRSDRSFEPIKPCTSIFSMPNTSVWDLCKTRYLYFLFASLNLPLFSRNSHHRLIESFVKIPLYFPYRVPCLSLEPM